MKILQIVEESPSLDFTLPIFNELNAEIEIIVLSTRPTFNYWFNHNPEDLLPSKKENIKFLDLISISKFPLIIKNIFFTFTKNNRNNTNNFLTKLLRKIFTFVIELNFNLDQVFKEFKKEGGPDLIIVDSRNDLRTTKVFKDIFNFIHDNEVKTIAVPVSTYVREGIEIDVDFFTQKKKEGEYPFNTRPKNFEFWTTTEQPNYQKQLNPENYKVVGYSGLDNKWLKHFNKKENSNYEINILINIKHFSKKIKTQNNPGPYSINEIEDFFSNLHSLEIHYPEYKFNFILKPHYYMNYKDLKKTLNKSKINNYEILRTSIYKAINKIDIVVGLHTSVNIITSAAGVATILYPETQMNIIGATDQKTIKMYTSHPGFTENIREFENLFKDCLSFEVRKKLGKDCVSWSKEFFNLDTIENIKKILISNR